ncbi:MAG: hypothetical protein EA351_07630 [Gemmatimonadales bacterium]|nr:MAG: hypothetical protein EA351_07630 [Gemmatimonadales bacterium]
MSLYAAGVLLSLALSSGFAHSAPSTPDNDSLTRWGADGHRMAARTAVRSLPAEIPDFFVEAEDQLIWLNPEPDQWRDGDFHEMDQGFRYDHYIDLENIPGDILEESRDRWDFHARLVRAGLENPQRDVGFLPFAILELQQRLVNGFARWRNAEDPAVRRYLEARIINDAGILGHFVTDASQPHHTTIHFNGWDEAQVPNPEGYTTDRQFHSRFETQFVRAHVTLDHITPRVEPESPITVAGADTRTAVFAYIRQINGYVEELYRIDRDHGFAPDREPDPVSLAFAADRIADGAVMLRDLWWSAWVESEAVAAR